MAGGSVRMALWARLSFRTRHPVISSGRAVRQLKAASWQGQASMAGQGAEAMAHELLEVVEAAEGVGEGVQLVVGGGEEAEVHAVPEAGRQSPELVPPAQTGRACLFLVDNLPCLQRTTQCVFQPPPPNGPYLHRKGLNLQPSLISPPTSAVWKGGAYET